jgi:hypothetical protein
MASREWWAALLVVFGALLIARFLSSWGQSGRWAAKLVKRNGLNRKAHNG